MTFRAVVIDPPWPYQSGINGRPLPYRQMTIPEIHDLKISSLVAKEGYAFCWATNKHLGSALCAIESWGLTYRQTVAWRKRGRCALGGMFATDLEFVVVAQRIRPGTNAHGSRTKRVRVPTSLFDWPVGGHSEKPDEFYQLVSEIVDGPYADVFARKSRPGWVSLGDEIDGSDIASAIDAATWVAL